MLPRHVSLAAVIALLSTAGYLVGRLVRAGRTDLALPVFALTMAMVLVSAGIASLEADRPA